MCTWKTIFSAHWLLLISSVLVAYWWGQKAELSVSYYSYWCKTLKMLNWVNYTVALVPSSPVYSLMVQSGIVLEFIPNYDSLYFHFGLKFPVSKKSFVNLVDFHRRYVLWVRHLFSGFSNISELRNKLTRNWKHSEFPSWNYYNILTSLECFFPSTWSVCSTSQTYL